MSNEPDIRAKALSEKIYERLLLAYPNAHRQQFGTAMAQLFRDQYRDAVRESRGWGVVKLWLRTLPDVVNTSIAERLAALNPKKSMSDKVTALMRPATSPLVSFLTVFFIVFFLVLIASVTVTFLLPESYASTARIKVEPDQSSDSKQMSYDPYFIQTTFEIIQSQIILNSVIESLHLNTAWGKKYNGNQPIKSAESLEILKKRLQLAPVRNTQLIAITAYSDDPDEAARIANAVAESYRDYRVKARDDMMAEELSVLKTAYQEEATKIQQVQSDVESLRQQFKIPDTDASTAAEYHQLIEKQEAADRQHYLDLRSQLTGLETFDKKQLVDVLPNVVADNALSELIEKRNEAEQSFASLTNRYSLSSPKVVQVQTLLSTLNAQIDDRVAGIMASMKIQVHSMRSALDATEESNKTVIGAKAYWNKKRELQQLRDNHKLLYAKIETEKIDAQIPKNLVEITDRAEPGSRPVKPNKTLNVFIGAVAGGFLGLIAGSVSAWLSAKMGNKQRKSMASA